MDFDFFCIPLIFGCSSKVTPDGVQTPSICPNCHNLSLASGKKRTWFELCCVPVIPLSSKHVWICPICNWSAKTSDFQPQMPAAGPPGGYYPAPGHYPPPSQYPAPVYSPYGAPHAGPPHH
ncbi:hypothetical protein AGABI1DRAFT_104670 [Agaricus bisporus var. burnettii JB137-S8]|uniref:Zinc-ribbon 15 domain-containing protein n=1 Tax=Agaricus bisporus var. burnettii (strain JB137-S8 / ATCC MYA-4627 / FGSC 10392) TaxID=597362 RepID=K5XH78_AGABU|nr:uncharacterized protein AGABI1DRAFT_104670 [Agaricus bisporus var. burnettii JB137-S8]EKM82813.1 hypothetical protein AGABI1DRAFT_104670 [Agaricus bisporus var. burnettii JB137-S8]